MAQASLPPFARDSEQMADCCSCRLTHGALVEYNSCRRHGYARRQKRSFGGFEQIFLNAQERGGQKRKNEYFRKNGLARLCAHR